MPNGKKAERTYREMSTDTDTFCGRINRLMDYLKTNFPTQQIICLRLCIEDLRNLETTMYNQKKPSPTAKAYS